MSLSIPPSTLPQLRVATKGTSPATQPPSAAPKPPAHTPKLAQQAQAQGPLLGVGAVSGAVYTSVAAAVVISFVQATAVYFGLGALGVLPCVAAVGAAAGVGALVGAGAGGVTEWVVDKLLGLVGKGKAPKS